MNLSRVVGELNARLTACGIVKHRVVPDTVHYIYSSGKLPKPRWEAGRFDYSEKDVDLLFGILKERWGE